MKRIFKGVIYFVLEGAFGKKKWQNFFLILYNLSIKGFNLNNHDVKTDGELNLIKNLFLYLKNGAAKKINSNF